MSVLRPIFHFGKTRRNEPALIDRGCTITYGELTLLICQTASHLKSLGLRRGERIGLCLKDTAEHIITLLAVTHLGGVAAPLDWRARPTENSRFVDGLGLTGLIAEPDLRLTVGCPVYLSDGEWNSSVTGADPTYEPVGVWSDPFVISASSGSTGAPKFTVMTHLQYHFAAAGMLELMSLTGRHRFLCNLPLYYSGGRNSCVTHLLRGDCVVLYSSLFSPAEYVDVVNRNKITAAAVVPSMVRQLLRSGGVEPLLPGLTVLFCTGAPLHADEKRTAVMALTPGFCERYGTAETLAISVLKPGDFSERISSVGQSHSLIEIDIADDSGRSLRVGEAGKLRMRGPGVATPLAGLTNENSFRDGWYYPGEIARLDDAGYIFLEGRTSEIIIRKGAKIYPAEVEGALAEHPRVLEAAVIGAPADDHEEEVVAFVVVKEGLLVGELIAHCRTRLTPHKVPRRFHLVPELPKNTAGKIDKMALAKSLDEPTGS
jgi:acyl-coenzyme A synthetase/AMP-(fatty) acid ligase